MDNYLSIIKTMSKDVYKSFKVGSDILEIAKEFDTKLYNIKKINPAYPLSIELNPITSNYSPMINKVIKQSDILSYTIGLSSKQHGIIKTSQIRYFDRSNDAWSILYEGLNEACIAGIRTCGVDVKLSRPKEDINEILDSYDIKSIWNICGHNLVTSIIPNDTITSRIIPNMDPHPSMYKYCKGRMKVGERYIIDVYGTNFTKHVSVKDYEYPTIYYIPRFNTPSQRIAWNAKVNALTFSSSRNVAKWVFNKYNHVPFSAREIYSKFDIKSMYVKKLYEHRIIDVIRTKYVNLKNDKENMGICKHVAHTINITSNGVKVLC